MSYSKLADNACKGLKVEFESPILIMSRQVEPMTAVHGVLNEGLPDRIIPFDFVLVFSNLLWCEITSGWLSSVANFLFARIRVPAIKGLIVGFPGSPFQMDSPVFHDGPEEYMFFGPAVKSD